MARVQFEVSGQSFSISKEILENGPYTLLTKMCTFGNKEPLYIIDRPADVFEAILSMYQTGDLHIPVTSCPGAFLKEMEFWEMQPEMLSNCCFYRLQCFVDEQETLRTFRKSLFSKYERGSKLTVGGTCSTLENIRCRVWSIVDYRERSILSRVYFTLALFMVLISIFTLAYSTEPNFQRHMTNCERLEYMQSTDMKDFNLVAKMLGRHCDDSEMPEDFVIREVQHNLQGSAFIPPLPTLSPENEDDNNYRYIYVDEIDSIDFNISINTTDAHPILRDGRGKRVKVPNMKVRVYTLVVLETITLVFFTADFIVRLISCPCILRYFMSIINSTDAAALIGTYLHMLMLYLYKHERYKDDWMDILEYLQMLRSLRLFRIVKNVRASRVLVYSIRKNIKDLSILMLYLVCGACTFASLVYISEDKNTIASIPDGWYWAIVTMTTVGYGDVVPKTTAGRVFACLCAISGVLLFALTVPIFANQFVTLYQYAGIENNLPSTNDGGMSLKRASNGINLKYVHMDENSKSKENEADRARFIRSQSKDDKLNELGI